MSEDHMNNELTCPDCGKPVMRTAGVCPNCGAPLGSGESKGTGKQEEKKEVNWLWLLIGIGLIVWAVIDMSKLF